MCSEAEEEERECKWAAAVDAGGGRGEARQRTPGFVAIGASTVRGIGCTSGGGLWFRRLIACLAKLVQQPFPWTRGPAGCRGGTCLVAREVDAETAASPGWRDTGGAARPRVAGASCRLRVNGETG